MNSASAKTPAFERRTLMPIAVRPDDAAAALGISRSSLEKLVKEGKIRPPISIAGLRGVLLYDHEQLLADWRALRDEYSNANVNSWDDA